MQKICMFTCAMLLSSTALAEMAIDNKSIEQEKIDETRIFELGQINIFEDLSEKNHGLIVHKISKDAIDKIGAYNVKDAIKSMTGADVTSVGPRDETSISIRGYNSKYIPVLVDGIPVRVAFDGLLDIGRYTTNELSEIQVSKSLSSVLNGANNLAGTVNLVTKKPTKEKQGNIKIGLTFDNNGSNNGQKISLNSGSLVDNWYMQASGSYIDNSHFTMSESFNKALHENGGNRDNSMKKDENYFLKLGYVLQEGDEIAFSYNLQKAQKHTPVYAGTDLAAKVRYWRWPYWDKESFSLNSIKTFDDASYIKTKVFYDEFKNALYAYDDATYTTQLLGRSFKSYYDDYTLGGNIEAGRELFDKHITKVAFHFIRDNHSEHNEGDPSQRFFEDTYSVGLEDNWDIDNKLNAVYGFSYNKKEVGVAQDYQAGELKSFPMHDKKYFDAVVKLTYKLDKDAFIYGGVSKKNRFPTIKDRYSYRLGKAIPNPNLDVEKSYNAELGYSDIVFNNLNYEASLFYSQIKDAIQNQAVGGGITQMQNVGKARAYGLELSLKKYWLNNLEQGLSYTYLSKKNKSDENIKMLDAPRHKLFTYLDYKISNDFNVVPSVEYNSARYGELYSGELNGATRLAGYIKADIKFSYDINDKANMEFGINNITDSNYELYDGFFEEGRSYYINASYNF